MFIHLVIINRQTKMEYLALYWVKIKVFLSFDQFLLESLTYEIK